MAVATPALPPVAYFSMEIGLQQGLPTYSGGLGVLAGDTIRAAADLRLPMVAVTLAHRQGYFTQHLAEGGVQQEQPTPWRPEDTLPAVAEQVTVEVEGRPVRVRAWRYEVKGVTGHVVPVFLLDTRLPENSEYDQALTDALYGGDTRYRLCQEIVLGIGGAALLEATGTGPDQGTQYHINEGHAALLCLHLLEREMAGRPAFEAGVADAEAVARRCIFTTHTPVPAGHDRFPQPMARAALGPKAALLDALRLWEHGELNMTFLAMRCARFINGVALRHMEVSREMFPDFPIGAVTNGVHAATWTSAPLGRLFDGHMPAWRRDNMYLRYACTLPLDALRAAHAEAKGVMLDEVARRTGQRLDPAALTIGFARRSTPYKRADLVFSDLDRLRAIARDVGPLQFVFGGKAHPRDEGGKALIRRVYEAARQLGGALRVVYVENYEMALGGLLTSGCDVWLNTPTRPLEASGTSGMKAALNGVPSLSVLDGWWIEGCVEGATGWAVGGLSAPPDAEAAANPEAAAAAYAAADSADLYHKLEAVVTPLYYGAPDRWAEVMRSAIAVNGAFFNTQRMVQQYVQNAYAPGEGAAAVASGAAA